MTKREAYDALTERLREEIRSMDVDESSAG